jgi:alkylation response protein AidB-like acyl-CoA dehydrogenase
MDLFPTDAQNEIITTAVDTLTRELPADRMPKQKGTAPPPRDWRGLAEMGWFGLGLPEEAGGLGLSVIEEVLVVREFGRHLAPPSTISTILAGHLAAAAGDTALVEALMSGEKRAGFAVPSGHDLTAVDGPFNLLDSDGADLFVVWTPSVGLLADRDAFKDVTVVRAIDDSLQVCKTTGLDQSRVRARSEAADFQHRARLLTAAMLVGGAEATRDISAEYAKVRQQFGHPIAVFQAISHKCADMAVDCEASVAVLQYAAVCMRDGSAEAELYTAAAKVVAGHAARNAAASAMQIFGGYGQTYEYMPHFYLKRAHIFEALGGGAHVSGAPVLAAASTL